jgi:uncharacterized protein (DUF2062 family)
MNLHGWFQKHSLKLLAITDTPEAIAGGVAIGIFFGFTPLFGLKTLSAILFAWLTGSNILAAVIAGTLHDLILPFMPVIYWYEYQLGYWILNSQWPQRNAWHMARLSPHAWRSWTTFVTLGKPMLLGSAVCGMPCAGLFFLLTRRIVASHQRKKRMQLMTPEPPNPS